MYSFNCLLALKGENLPHATIQRSASPTAIAWQSDKKIVAIGWQTGEVIIWNEGERDLFEVPGLHKNVVTCLKWSAKGARLVSADQVCHS